MGGGAFLVGRGWNGFLEGVLTDVYVPVLDKCGR